MRKRVVAAAFGFLTPFCLFTAILYGASERFKLLDTHQLGQYLLLIAGVSLLIGSFTALSSSIQEQSSEQDNFGREITEGVGLLFLALLVLRKRSFAPLWLSLIPLLIGSAMVNGQHPMAGILLILVAQTFWFFSRLRLRHYIDHAPFDGHLYPYLVWLHRGMDLIFVVALAGAATALREFGEIIDNIGLMASAALFASSYVLYQEKKEEQPLDMGTVLKICLWFVWISTALATLNFGFDFREPYKTQRLTYESCVLYRQGVLNGSTKVDENMQDCHHFSSVKDPSLYTKMEFTYHPGALYVRWKRGRLIE